MCRALERYTSRLWLVGASELSKIKRKHGRRRYTPPSGLGLLPPASYSIPALQKGFAEIFFQMAVFCPAYGKAFISI
jgi:hypothetical protein